MQPSPLLPHFRRRRILLHRIQNIAPRGYPHVARGALVGLQRGKVRLAAPGTFAPDIEHLLRDLAAYTVIEQSANSIITELCAQL